jgi:hypothetical protein
MQFVGTLADGTKLSQTLPLAGNGQWPVYTPLYKGKGSIFGWLTLTDAAGSDISGLLIWTKPPGVAGPLYPGGLVTPITVLGSHYHPPLTGTPLLNLTDAVLAFDGGDLGTPFAVDALLDPSNKASVALPNISKVTIKLMTTSGIISGTFVNPTTLAKRTFNGVLLQKQNAGGGYFLGASDSGYFYFGQPGNFPLFLAAP